MNLIPEIAQKLGVEIGEPFNVKVINSNIYPKDIETKTFKFNKIGVAIDFENGFYRCDLLADLLNGTLEIVKIPFMPKEGETYWFIGEVKERYKDYKLKSFVPLQAEWIGSFLDHMNYALGNCFPTETKAAAGRKEIVKKVLGKDV